MNIEISDATSEDLEDILTLQKIAYKSEAEIHDDYSILPLHQTMNEIINEFQSHLLLKVVDQKKIIGSVRAYEKNGTCFIGKLIVNPAYQNRGIGTKLLTEIEKRFKDIKRFELFTGYKSEKNLYIYNKIGYNEFSRKKISDKLTLIFLEKIH
ncbi:MAG: GNAT family N-acetyltransferase [Candidatus Latescibacteria bacterium]|jgi:ribosomal protein S18 acetylase RimI-like enzyme|nr:GNAT family N-acetyltransferase [Candidatus Latescibacterota bacterium]